MDVFSEPELINTFPELPSSHSMDMQVHSAPTLLRKELGPMFKEQVVLVTVFFGMEKLTVIQTLTKLTSSIASKKSFTFPISIPNNPHTHTRTDNKNFIFSVSIEFAFCNTYLTVINY